MRSIHLVDLIDKVQNTCILSSTNSLVIANMVLIGVIRESVLNLVLIFFLDLVAKCLAEQNVYIQLIHLPSFVCWQERNVRN